jgi:hypothetical protein
MQPQAGQDDHDSEEEESRSGAAVPTAVPKANAPTVSSDVLSDVAGVGDAQGGLQEDGVHHQTMSVKLHQSLICALLGLGTCGSCSSLSIHFDQLNVCTV